jgi:hypothetical protein
MTILQFSAPTTPPALTRSVKLSTAQRIGCACRRLSGYEYEYALLQHTGSLSVDRAFSQDDIFS